MPICKKIIENKTKEVSSKKCTFKLNNYEKFILLIAFIGLLSSFMSSCTPANKVHCNGNKKMAIYNSGGYR
jgi:hypothetical protein